MAGRPPRQKAKNDARQQLCLKPLIKSTHLTPYLLLSPMYTFASMHTVAQQVTGYGSIRNKLNLFALS